MPHLQGLAGYRRSMGRCPRLDYARLSGVQMFSVIANVRYRQCSRSSCAAATAQVKDPRRCPPLTGRIRLRGANNRDRGNAPGESYRDVPSSERALQIRTLCRPFQGLAGSGGLSLGPCPRLDYARLSGVQMFSVIAMFDSALSVTRHNTPKLVRNPPRANTPVQSSCWRGSRERPRRLSPFPWPPANLAG
jgi:hypothetical protein